MSKLLFGRKLAWLKLSLGARWETVPLLGEISIVAAHTATQALKQHSLVHILFMWDRKGVSWRFDRGLYLRDEAPRLLGRESQHC